MFGIPLHPALVHIPLGIAFIMPFLVVGIWISIHKNWMPNKSWVILIVFQLILFGSGLLASETGENDEDLVEKVVQEQVIDNHEEKAELFVKISGLLVLLLAAGLWPHKRYGMVIKGASVLAVVANLALASFVGHSGGELVYKHNAASAHVPSITSDSGLLIQQKNNDGDDD